MKVIQLSRGLVAIVDDCDFERLAQWNWHADHKGYACRHDPSDHRKSIRMHREILEPPPGFEVDHVNGQKADNRRCNIRIATDLQNSWNRVRRKDNTAGFKGVCKIPSGFRARIHMSGGRKHLGTFATAEEAATAYNEVAREIHGEFDVFARP